METILLTCQHDVATLTFNRPEKLNAFNYAMSQELLDILQDLDNDTSIRAILIKGAGEAYMTGTDMHELYHNIDVVSAEALNMIRQFNASILLMRQMNKPIISAVHGLVMGVGMSIMLASDLVIAVSDTKFALGYNRVGLSPAGAMSYLLPRLVGTKHAFELMLLSEVIDAETAKSYGIINCIIDENKMTHYCHQVIERLIHGPTVAITQTKHLLNSAWQNKLTTQLELEAESFLRCINTKDFKQAVKSFVNKTVPEFEGR